MCAVVRLDTVCGKLNVILDRHGHVSDLVHRVDHSLLARTAGGRATLG